MTECPGLAELRGSGGALRQVRSPFSDSAPLVWALTLIGTLLGGSWWEEGLFLRKAEVLGERL